MSGHPELDPRRFAVERASLRGFEQVYAREGRGGVPLLLIHDWPATRRLWWRNLGALAEAGFEVVAPDLRGFGDSGGGSVGDLAGHARDLYALLRGRLGYRRVSVVGGGAGGALAQDLALRFPGFVERLVLFGCPPLRAGKDLTGETPLRAGEDLTGGASARCARSSAARRGRLAAIYTDGRHTRSGAFRPEEVTFLVEPFADAARVAAARAFARAAAAAVAGPGPPRRNPTLTWIAFGELDAEASPALDDRAREAFPHRVGPLRVPSVGRFPQWETSEWLNRAIGEHCARAPRPAGCERAFVSLGSNLGDREVRLCAAVAALRATRGIADVVCSAVYETDPVGPGAQGPYLNAVVQLDTTLGPEALLERLLAIERDEGRTRSGVRNEARTLDLDLLLHGERLRRGPRLELPHPRLAERPFVLEPLCDLAPELVHPTCREPIARLAARVRDPAAVRRHETLPD